MFPLFPSFELGVVVASLANLQPHQGSLMSNWQQLHAPEICQCSTWPKPYSLQSHWCW